MVCASFSVLLKVGKKVSDPNLASPVTPAPPSGLTDDHSCQENIVEEFATPKACTPKTPGRLPLNNEQLTSRVEPSTTVGDDIDTDVLIQMTNNLNKAISQQDINTFRYILYLSCDNVHTYN